MMVSSVGDLKHLFSALQDFLFVDEMCSFFIGESEIRIEFVFLENENCSYC